MAEVKPPITNSFTPLIIIKEIGGPFQSGIFPLQENGIYFFGGGEMPSNLEDYLYLKSILKSHTLYF